MRIDEILDLLRTQSSPAMAWQGVLEQCNADDPSTLWQSLPAVDIEGDAASACAWLERSLVDVDGPIGLYLGLDTLNMQGGSGYNLELGWSRDADPASEELDWLYERLQHGSRFLIGGLVGLREEYGQPRWKAEFSSADYQLFLGYSGIVLAQALRRLERADPTLAAWGFHDGDLFALCRGTGSRVEMICR